MAFPWEQLITAGATLAGALGGVLLTQRYGARQERSRRLDARRDYIREHLTVLIEAAQEWATLQREVALGLGQMSDDQLVTLAESESGKRLSDLRHTVNRSFVRLSLYLGDPQLREPYEGSLHRLRTVDTMMENLYTSGRGGSDSTSAANLTDAAVSELDRFQDEIGQLRAAASRLLVIRLGGP